MPETKVETKITILDACKKAVRLSNNAYDDDINELIEACKLDLKISGVAPSLIKDDDALIRQAIKTYCKANFGYSNIDNEKFKQSYDLLKRHLAIAYKVAPKEEAIASE